MTRARVLCLVSFYLPGYKGGGPIRTVANMVEQLSEELDFRIITSDRDHKSERPYEGVRLNEWNGVGNAQVYYASPENRSLHRLARLISQTQHDILYLNSFFDPHFTIYPLLARRLRLIPRRPTVIAPRGEFSDGALAFKAWKKRSYIFAARLAGLYQGLIWQASSDYEARDIRLAMRDGSQRVAVTPNLPPRVQPIPVRSAGSARRKEHPLRVCFLSRISPKKNLDFALRMLSRVRMPVLFDIYGPVEDAAYWRTCQELMARIRHPVTVCYKGDVPHEAVSRVLGEYDLFFLPTHGENFGHVILEALLVGTPVLISDTTPWRGLEGLGVGCDLPLDNEQAFVDAIEFAASRDGVEYESWRNRVAEYGRRCVQDPVTVEANKGLFRSLRDCSWLERTAGESS